MFDDTVCNEFPLDKTLLLSSLKQRRIGKNEVLKMKNYQPNTVFGKLLCDSLDKQQTQRDDYDGIVELIAEYNKTYGDTLQLSREVSPPPVELFPCFEVL